MRGTRGRLGSRCFDRLITTRLALPRHGARDSGSGVDKWLGIHEASAVPARVNFSGGSSGEWSHPRGVLNSNRGFVELGSHALNRLRRKPIIEFYAWNVPPTSNKERNDPGRPGRDSLRLARYYESLLHTGKFESRAGLARFLGVSRANVTQVLNRLKSCASNEPHADEARPEAAG